LIFDQDNIAFTVLDVLELHQENRRLSQQGRPFGALSFRYDSDTLIDVGGTAHDVSNTVCYFPPDMPYTRIPVYEGAQDNIVGILPVTLFMSHYVAGKPIVLRKLLLKPYVCDSRTEIFSLLQRMRLNKLHMVFVTDDTKTKIGIITMEDLLEELVGDIQDESDAGEGLHLQ